MSNGLKLEVTDYARIEKVQVEMPPPPVVVAIAGKNGSGKTTTLQAIAAAFAYRDRGYTVRHGTEGAEINVELPDGRKIEMRLSADGRATYRLDGRATTAGTVAELAPALSVSLEKWANLTTREAVKECQRIVKGFDAEAYLAEQNKLDTLLEPSGDVEGSLRHAKRVHDHAQRNLDSLPVVAKDDTEPLPMPQEPETLRLDDSYTEAVLQAQSVVERIAAEGNAAVEAYNQAREAHASKAAKTQQYSDAEREVERLQLALDAAKARAEALRKETLAMPEIDTEAAKAKTVELRDKHTAAKAKQQEAEAAKNEAQAKIDELNAEARSQYNAEVQRIATENARRSAAKVQAEQYRVALKEVAEAKSQHMAIEDEVKATRERQAAILSAAKWPLPGMMIGEQGIIYNGIPLSRASAGERLRIGVALSAAMAGDGEKIFTIENASLLDEDAWAEIEKLATETNATILAEVVGETPREGIPTIIIRDGKNINI